MNTEHRQMLTDSIVDKIMLIGRTADTLRGWLVGPNDSAQTKATVEVELAALREFVREIAQLAALEEFDYVEIAKVYERLDAVVARAYATKP